MRAGTFSTRNVPISTVSARPSSSPRMPTRPTPALSVLVIGRTPTRCAVACDSTICSAPVSTTRSISSPFTRPRTITLSRSSRNGTACASSSCSGATRTGTRSPNDRRKRISDRAHSIFWSMRVPARSSTYDSNASAARSYRCMRRWTDPRVWWNSPRGSPATAARSSTSPSSSRPRAARPRPSPWRAMALPGCAARTSRYTCSASSNRPNAHNASAYSARYSGSTGSSPWRNSASCCARENSATCSSDLSRPLDARRSCPGRAPAFASS